MTKGGRPLESARRRNASRRSASRASQRRRRAGRMSTSRRAPLSRSSSSTRPKWGRSRSSAESTRRMGARSCCASRPNKCAAKRAGQRKSEISRTSLRRPAMEPAASVSPCAEAPRGVAARRRSAAPRAAPRARVAGSRRSLRSIASQARRPKRSPMRVAE